MRKWIITITAALLAGLSACSGPQELLPANQEGSDIIQSEQTTIQKDTLKEEAINALVDDMTTEEKVAQLFITTPDDLLGSAPIFQAGEETHDALEKTPIGGLIYLAQNLQSTEQVQTMLSNTQQYSLEITGIPMFLCLDEEGGTVTRISGRSQFNVPDIGDMADIGATGDTAAARSIGVQIGQYMSNLGFNLDLAPVADVLTNPENTVVKARSFGSNPITVSAMALALSEGLNHSGVYSTFKHFPGHGATAADTHAGYAYTKKTLEELKQSELIPFYDCIEADAQFIMVSHISLPNVVGNDTPASLSPMIIQDLLRKQMGYEGIVITDAIDMGAIAQKYSVADAAINSILAGSDIILMGSGFHDAYNAVLKAVQDGIISKDRLDTSIHRILDVK